jgi:hypothetical protein
VPQRAQDKKPFASVREHPHLRHRNTSFSDSRNVAAETMWRLYFRFFAQIQTSTLLTLRMIDDDFVQFHISVRVGLVGCRLGVIRSQSISGHVRRDEACL